MGSLRSWRARVEHYGLDFEDGMAPFLDLRFADDLLLFAASKEELIFMLEELTGALQEVGLVLNASKTFVLTAEAQPPTSLRLQNGAEVSVFYANKSILSDKSVSIAQRLAYFDAMVTPVACFASGHRKIYKQDLRKLWALLAA